MFAGDQEPGLRGVRKPRFALSDVARIHRRDRNAIIGRLGAQGVEPTHIRIRPSDDHRIGFKNGQVQPVLDFEVFGIAVSHAAAFQRPRRRIEPRMQDRAVAFAGAIENVGGFFQHHDARAIQRKPARDGAADDARADHGDVEHLTR